MFHVIYCGNANGDMIPSHFIYYTKLKISDWLLGGPLGSRLSMTKSGWIDCDCEWFERQLLPLLKKGKGRKSCWQIT